MCKKYRIPNDEKKDWKKNTKNIRRKNGITLQKKKYKCKKSRISMKKTNEKWFKIIWKIKGKKIEKKLKKWKEIGENKMEER